jgi:hypothetical protein
MQVWHLALMRMFHSPAGRLFALLLAADGALSREEPPRDSSPCSMLRASTARSCTTVTLTTTTLGSRWAGRQVPKLEADLQGLHYQPVGFGQPGSLATTAAPPDAALRNPTTARACNSHNN